MRPQQQNRRMRGRNNGGGGSNNNNNNNRRGPNPLTRNYESNGPDVKIRGSAQQIAEKYATLARDAQSSGDRVMAENYLQHAEHYNRIIAAAQAQFASQQVQAPRDDMDDDLDDAGYGYEGGVNGGGEAHQQQQPQSMQHQPQPEVGSGPQPIIEGMPAEVALNSESAGQQHQGGNRHRDRRHQQRHHRNDMNGGDVAPNAVGEQAPVQPVQAVVEAVSSPVEAAPMTATQEAETPEQEFQPRRGRKPRRGRSSDQTEGGEVASDTGSEPEIVSADS